MYRASVVIPTLDRPGELLSCLQALSVEFPRDAEVIVVSDGGDRNQLPELGGFRETLNLKLLNVDHGGPAHARNEGLRRVSSPVVLFLDDDCLPQRGWLKYMIEAVSVSPPVGVGGSTLNGLPDNIYSSAAQLVLDLLERDQQEQGYEPPFFPSNNLAFPTAALQAMGGFNSQFLTSEDRELCRRWLQAGHALTKSPHAVILHSPKLNLARYWRKFRSYGAGAARFHGASAEQWGKNSVAFHFRVPALAVREMAARGLRRRPTLLALLVLWEVANLAGFIGEKWRKRKHRRVERSGGRETG